VKKKFVQAVGAAAATCALVLLPAMTAQASQGAAIIGSQAYYNTGTKVLSVTDTQADGKSAIAELRKASGATVYSVTESRGVNNTTTKQVFTISGSFQIRACVKNYSAGTAKSCGAWINGS
jgi:hypothetical protein